MLDRLEEIAGPTYAPAIFWTLVALAALVVLLVLIRMVRGLRKGARFEDGRARRPRLAILDATAVDQQRRLVLVRRDDVEHLILIGGPNDVVVESSVRQVSEAAPIAVQRPPAPAPVEHRPEPVPAPPRPAPVAQPQQAVAPAPSAAPIVAVPARDTATADPVEEAMIREFEGGQAKPSAPPQRREPTLDEEMTSLLGDRPERR